MSDPKTQEERCEACKTLYVRYESDIALANRHHALLAEERKKRKEAEKKLAEAVRLLRLFRLGSEAEPPNGRTDRLLASIDKREVKP